MIDMNLISHVTKDHAFKIEYLFYRFAEDEKDRGHAENETDSWHAVLPKLGEEGKIDPSKLEAALNGMSDILKKGDPNHVPHMMFDEHNCDLYDQVRPINWVDP